MTDPLAEVLRMVRLAGGVFLDARFTAPWAVTAGITPQDCLAFMPPPRQIVGYHVMLSGHAFVTVEGEVPLALAPGEIVLLPRNDVHVLSSKVGHRPVPAQELMQSSDDGGLTRIVFGGGGEAAHMVCGFLASEDQFNPLIAALPRLLKIGVRESMSNAWIEASMQFAANELVQGRLASSNTISRLSELLFVEAVRSYAATTSDIDTGWLRGLCDTQIGKALALLHGDIRHAWKAETLARAVGLSRTAFIDRFSTTVGVPPISYLIAWRLRTAKTILRESRRSIAETAFMVGYESEAAFSRAFKRQFGQPPAEWRQGVAAPAAL